MGKKKSGQIEYQVAFGKTFNYYYNKIYSETTLDLIDDFIEHYEEHGFTGWKGKVAQSNRVPDSYADQAALIAKANKYKLWHVHIGAPKWIKSRYGQYYTSEWVLHFKRESKYKIVLLDLGWHNPMLLPSDDICEEETV